MELVISNPREGVYEVRSSTGYYAKFETMDDAANHADGFAKGYNAAVAKLDKCHGWRRG